MKARYSILSLTLLLIATLLIAPMGAFAASSTATGSKILKNINVSGTLEDGSTFDGKVSLTNLAYDLEKGLLADGEVKGTVTKADGTVQDVKETFNGVTANLTGAESAMSTLAAQQQEEGCQILFLDLGPLNLDLLGLQLDLSQIVLDLTAVPGPGNLLGNLLCSVAGLLDGNGLLSDVTGLLGQLTGLLDQVNNLLGR
ncbi:hypothetical protein [Bacillus sp. ISL-39]|uniref:hypothetical protein n=1 Tax=Bacillus sp. ISL-39 TaxID=2819124 RepID=UPI001BEBA1C8|nr:hypothetical protein [Bacillus sp. ISL-39]MBT2636814.1 hypothetical protein [Bacillus sp. ISL-39]